MQFRDLKKQYQVLKPEIDNALQRICSDASFIGGAPVRELETKLAEYVGVKHCVTCANGTDALRLAEMAYGIGTGDAVFVADFTFFSSAETAAVLGATPVFVDIDERTFNIDPKALEAAIVRVLAEGKLSPKAIVAVDLFGLPADYIELEPIAEKYGLILIEDGAQGFGGRIGNRQVCSFGDIATTSFFPAKPLGCYGDGGAIFTNDDEMDALIRSYCVHGKSGSDKYNNVRLGLNSRLDTIQAAILLAKFEPFVNHELAAVNQAATWYDEALNGTGLVLPLVPESCYSSWAQYTVQLRGAEQRNAVQAALKAKGIPSMVYYPKGMHQQGAFGALPYHGECPVSEKLCRTVLSLPMHPYMEKATVEEVCNVLKEALQTCNQF